MKGKHYGPCGNPPQTVLIVQGTAQQNRVEQKALPPGSPDPGATNSQMGKVMLLLQQAQSVANAHVASTGDGAGAHAGAGATGGSVWLDPKALVATKESNMKTGGHSVPPHIVSSEGKGCWTCGNASAKKSTKKVANWTIPSSM